jgi:hypothetical protein
LQAVQQVRDSGRLSAGHGRAAERAQQAQQVQQAEVEFEAAAQLVLLPRAKLLPLVQPEQALADAAGMLGRQVLLPDWLAGTDASGCVHVYNDNCKHNQQRLTPPLLSHAGAGRRCPSC